MSSEGAGVITLRGIEPAVIAVPARSLICGTAVVRRQTPAMFPADTFELTCAGPMVVGPITVATWPTAGPMNERPLPIQT
jgi:hypothetical protein